MRLKKIPSAGAYIASYPELAIVDGKALKGKWQTLFPTQQPLHVEIGMGKGGFIHGMASQNPDINYVGIELYDSVLMRALEKLVKEPLPNLRLLLVDARELTEVFAAGEVGQVYLNFSDPWPKTRHAKRRLTHEGFLDIYKAILPKHGHVQLKTDNQSLFEYSLMSFNAYGMTFSDVCVDLHANPERYPHNVMTEYEQKFHKKGQPIYLVGANF